MKIIFLALGIICLLFIANVGAYEIKTDRSLDANCLGYSKEIVNEIISEGGTATLIAFREVPKQGHCMVLVNYKTEDRKIIESYTGQEFTDVSDLWKHLTDLLNTSNLSMSIKEGNDWTAWQKI